jgi:hypothetical protein
MLGEGGGRSWTKTTASSSIVDVEEASWARWLLASKAAAWIGLVARVWLGYEWIYSGREKVIHTST